MTVTIDDPTEQPSTSAVTETPTQQRECDTADTVVCDSKSGTSSSSTLLGLFGAVFEKNKTAQKPVNAIACVLRG